MMDPATESLVNVILRLEQALETSEQTNVSLQDELNARKTRKAKTSE